jgi:hypothetical protein
MMELIHMTAGYSNAVLVALLPHISEFAGKLNLPVKQPVTAEQVVWAGISPYKDWVCGAVVLTNHYWFGLDHRGFVDSFHAPTNWFYEQEFTDIGKYAGQDHMTTNEVIAMARDALRKLGYKPALAHSDKPPALEGPCDIRKDHVPYCRVTWTEDVNKLGPDRIEVEVNMETKALVGMTVSFSPTNNLTTTPMTVSVVPELESDYRARTRRATRP